VFAGLNAMPQVDIVKLCNTFKLISLYSHSQVK
jgi:hypothetical protein